MYGMFASKIVLIPSDGPQFHHGAVLEFALCWVQQGRAMKICEKNCQLETGLNKEYHLERRWCNIPPKRWRTFRGYDKPRLMGVEPSTFPGGVGRKSESLTQMT